MGNKTNLTISIDSEIVEKLGANKSDEINSILRRELCGVEGIKKQIEYYELKIDSLRKEIDKLTHFAESKENIPDKVITYLEHAVKVLNQNPGQYSSYIKLWTNITNQKAGTNYTQAEFEQLVRKWQEKNGK